MNTPSSSRDGNNGQQVAEATARILLLLTLFQMILPLTIDVSLPALPLLQQSFGATQAGIQSTIAAFFATFGIFQLFWGPASDRFGRKKPALSGVLLFILGSIGCAVSSSVQFLTWARVAQAMGSCAMMVIGSAMVRDLYSSPDEEGRTRSLLLMLASLGPICGVVVGGQIVKLAGAHAIFVLQAAIGILILLLILMTPETLRLSLRSKQPALAMLHTYARVLRSRAYLGYALSGALMTASMLVYLAASPFIFIEYFKVPATSYGLYTGAIALSMALMSMLGRHLIRKVGARLLLRTGIVIGMAAMVTLILVTASDSIALAVFFVPLFVSVSTIGFTTPNSVALALAGLPDAAGAGAAVFGALAIGLGGAATSILSALSNGTPRPMMFVMGVCCVLALLCNVCVARSNPGDR